MGTDRPAAAGQRRVRRPGRVAAAGRAAGPRRRPVRGPPGPADRRAARVADRLGRLAGRQRARVQLHGRHLPRLLPGRAGARARRTGRHRGSAALGAGGGEPWARLVLAAGLAGTGIWAYVLLGRTPDWHPWLRPLVLLAAVGAAIALLVPELLAGRPGLAIAGVGAGGSVAGAVGVRAVDGGAAAHRRDPDRRAGRGVGRRVPGARRRGWRRRFPWPRRRFPGRWFPGRRFPRPRRRFPGRRFPGRRITGWRPARRRRGQRQHRAHRDPPGERGRLHLGRRDDLRLERGARTNSPPTSRSSPSVGSTARTSRPRWPRSSSWSPRERSTTGSAAAASAAPGSAAWPARSRAWVENTFPAGTVGGMTLYDLSAAAASGGA